MKHRLYAIGLLLTAAVGAQPIPPEYIGEFATYFGPSTGPGPAHLSVGGSSAIAAGRWAMAGFDVAYTPLGNSSLRWLPEGTVQNSRLYDINFNVHVRVPSGFRRAQLYGILGAGLLHNTFQSGAASGTVVIYTSDCTDNFAFHTGAGVRYYLGDGWGFRPEVRAVVSAKNYVRFSFGIFAEVSALDWFRARRGGGGRPKIR